MCLIIFRKKDAAIIDDSILDSAFEANGDGIGLMYLNRFNNPVIIKTFNYDKIYHYVRFLESNNVAFGLHFRFMTHGKIELKNCHPFPVNYKSFLMHNGVLPDAAKLSNNGSQPDTVGFIDSFMRDAIYTKSQIEKLIGFNKFLELNQNGFTVYNEPLWTEHEGSLYSNDFSLPNAKFNWKKPSRYYSSEDVYEGFDFGNYSGFNLKTDDELELDMINDRLDNLLKKHYGYIQSELKSIDSIDKLDLLSQLIDDLSDVKYTF